MGQNVGSAAISQSTTVCAGTGGADGIAYVLTWNSGIATSTDTSGSSCNLAVFIGDQQVASGRPCTDPMLPCTPTTDRPNVMYRTNQYLYYAQAGQTVDIMFDYQCDSTDGNVVNLVDDVSFERTLC
jgi:hypothetical protein